MQSRLEILNPELSKQLNSMSLDEAETKVILILSERLASFPDKVIQHLPHNFEIQSYTIFQDHVDALDYNYFAAEEAGSVEDASASFMAARFLSAVLSLQGAGGHFDLCEAAYEAHFSQSRDE